MKRLFLLSLSLFVSSAFGMQQEPINLAASSSSQAQETILRFEVSDGSEHSIPEKYVKCSETIKHQIEELGNQHAIPLSNIANTADFNLFARFLKYVFEIKQLKQQNLNNELTEKESEITKGLEQLSLVDLQKLITICNYYDVQTILDVAIEVIAEKLMQKDRVVQCLKDGFYKLASATQDAQSVKLNLNIDLAQLVAQKMLAKTAAKTWFVNTVATQPMQHHSINNLSHRPIAYAPQSSRYALIRFYNQNQVFIENENNLNEKLREPIYYINHNGAASLAVFSCDDTHLATQSFDGTIKVFDIAAQKEIATFTDALLVAPDNKPNTKLALGKTGKILAYFTRNFKLKIINIETNETLFESQEPLVNPYLCFHENAQLLAYRMPNGTIKIINTHNFAEVSTITGDFIDICDMRFSRNGKDLAICMPYEIRVYNVKTRQMIFCKKISDINSNYSFRAICFNENSSLLAAYVFGTITSQLSCGYIYVWDIKNNYQIIQPLTINQATARIFECNKDRLAVSHIQGIEFLALTSSQHEDVIKAQIRTPEQIAVLLQAYDCAHNGLAFNAQLYPGLTNIALPESLKELKNPSFIQPSWSNWLSQSMQSFNPFGAALMQTAYNAFKKQ